MLSLLRKTRDDKDNSRYFVRNWSEIFRNYKWMKLHAVWRYRLCQSLYEVAVVIGIIVVIVAAPEILDLYQEVIEALNNHDYSEDADEIESVDGENSNGEDKETYSTPIMEPPRGTTGDVIVKADTEKSNAAKEAAKEALTQADTRAKSNAERQQAEARQQQAERDSLREQAEAKAQEAIEKADAVPDKPSILDVIETLKAGEETARETIESHTGGWAINLIDDVLGGIINVLGGGNVSGANTEQALEIERGIMDTLEKGGYRDDEGKVNVEALTDWIEHTDLPTNVNYGVSVARGSMGGEDFPGTKESLEDYAQALADYFDAKDEAQQAQQEAEQAQEEYEKAPEPTEIAGDEVTSETTYTTESGSTTVTVTETTYGDGTSTVEAIGDDGSSTVAGTDSSGGFGVISTDSEGNTTYEYTDSEGNTSSYTETSGGGEGGTTPEDTSPAQPPDGSTDDLDGNDISGGS